MRFEDLVNRFDIVKEGLKRRPSYVPDFSTMQRLIGKYQRLRQEQETFRKMRRQLDMKTGFRKKAGHLTSKNQDNYQKVVKMLEQFDKQLVLIEQLICKLAATWPKIPAQSVPKGTKWRTVLTHKRHTNQADLINEASKVPDILKTQLTDYGYASPPTSLKLLPNSHKTYVKSYSSNAQTPNTLKESAEAISTILKSLDYSFHWLECPLEYLPLYSQKRYVFSIYHEDIQSPYLHLCVDDLGVSLQKPTQAFIALSFTETL